MALYFKFLFQILLLGIKISKLKQTMVVDGGVEDVEKKKLLAAGKVFLICSCIKLNAVNDYHPNSPKFC